MAIVATRMIHLKVVERMLKYISISLCKVAYKYIAVKPAKVKNWLNEKLYQH
jgi:hypothetical protein